MSAGPLLVLSRDAKANLECVRDALQAMGALAKVQFCVRAMWAVDQLIYALEDQQRAESWTRLREAQGKAGEGAPGPDIIPAPGPGEGPEKGPGKGPE